MKKANEKQKKAKIVHEKQQKNKDSLLTIPLPCAMIAPFRFEGGRTHGTHRYEHHDDAYGHVLCFPMRRLPNVIRIFHDVP
ncbi:MAG: hypothetical protein Q4B32_02515 [Clostridia bacterium]|nr:hypothetical protein [Clostridia bacterium]